MKRKVRDYDRPEIQRLHASVKAMIDARPHFTQRLRWPETISQEIAQAFAAGWAEGVEWADSHRDGKPRQRGRKGRKS